MVEKLAGGAYEAAWNAFKEATRWYPPEYWTNPEMQFHLVQRIVDAAVDYVEAHPNAERADG